MALRMEAKPDAEFADEALARFRLAVEESLADAGPALEAGKVFADLLENYRDKPRPSSAGGPRDPRDPRDPMEKCA